MGMTIEIDGEKFELVQIKGIGGLSEDIPYGLKPVKPLPQQPEWEVDYLQFDYSNERAQFLRIDLGLSLPLYQAEAIKEAVEVTLGEIFDQKGDINKLITAINEARTLLQKGKME